MILSKMRNNKLINILYKQQQMQSSGMEIKELIMKNKNIIGVLINGELKDLQEFMELNLELISDLSFVCVDDIYGLSILRHSFAHLLAHALTRLYPNISLNIGPATENGFYHDFRSSKTISSKDFPKIEAEMRKIINENIAIVRKKINLSDALELYKNDTFKLKLLEKLKNEELTFYAQGDFGNLCKGPHVENTGLLLENAFKLTNISEITSGNDKYQRIEGLAFDCEKNLQIYEELFKNMANRDHRILGEKLDLFSFSEMATNIPFWHQNGVLALEKLKILILKIFSSGHQQLITPELYNKELWEKTGHWQKYRHNMFCIHKDDGEINECLKPMNCPAHLIYIAKTIIKNKVIKEEKNPEDNTITKKTITIINDKHLPYRILEFGRVFRNEEKGGLIGIKRARSFVQDDGHFLCKLEHIESEVKDFLEKAFKLYRSLGFNEFFLRIADRPENSIGSDNDWKIAEEALKNVLKDMKYQFQIDKGGGAFYGPKIEIHLLDNMRHLWQCGTIQIDFNLPTRLGVFYREEDNLEEKPLVFLHRAALGSLERFFAVLLEHHNGLPVIIHPNPVALIGISEDLNDYEKEIISELKKNNIDFIIPNKSQHLNKRIKSCIEEHIPYIIIFGEKELKERTLSLRLGLANKTITLKELIDEIIQKSYLNL